MSNPTVLVLGAGASSPYNFPVGDQLRVQIGANFVNDYSDLISA